MFLSEIIGQPHAYKLGQLLIEQKPRLILITGPLGCGKTSYAEALISGIGGEGTRNRFVPDELTGSWTLVDGAEFNRDSWGRLIELVDSTPDHVTILVTPDLDSVPRAVQSRAVRVVLRSLSRQDVRSYTENQLVKNQLPYSPEALDRLVTRASGDLRVVQGLISAAIVNGGLTEALLVAFGEDLPHTVSEIYRLLADGYLPEAKAKGDAACASFTPEHLAKELLEQYANAHSKSPGPLAERIRFRFPDVQKTTNVLLKWFSSKLPIGSPVGSLIVHELNAVGVRVEDPRVVEERRKAEEERVSKTLKGRPELNLDPALIANRKNLDVPIYEDKSIPMDPRVREQLKKEAEAKQKIELKKAHLQPSCVISTSSMGDSNPFGITMPHPSQVPKGIVLGTAFAKLCRAKKVTAEDKWDLVYKEKAAKESARAGVVQLAEESGAAILTEDPRGFSIRIKKDSLPEFLEISNCEVETC